MKALRSQNDGGRWARADRKNPAAARLGLSGKCGACVLASCMFYLWIAALTVTIVHASTKCKLPLLDESALHDRAER
eukprot:6204418-Pleurochrysis_carterae.AAC.3